MGATKEHAMAADEHILLVDDDPILSTMYADRLRAEGYTVDVAHDGEAGFEAAKKKPDLILLDIMMPKMNGLDMLRLVKEEPGLENIPVILLTALIQELKQAKSAKGGAAAYFVKSEIVPGELIKEVQKILESKKGKKKKED
jgi:DNA-binding response OmpR family regulator